MNVFIARNSYIGIDVGGSSVKIVQFPGKKKIIASAIEIPSHLRKGDKELLNSFLIKSVSELIKKNKFKAAPAVSNLSSPSEIQILNISMPRMAKSDMKGAVGLEIRKTAGSEFEKGIFDFYVSGISGDGSLKVTAAAAQGGAVRKKMRLFELCGLSAAGLLSTGLALEALLTHTKFLEQEKNTLFINIGAAVTSLNFFKGKDIILSREVFSGSDDITAAMNRSVRTDEKNIEISYQNAENIKKTYGLMGDAPEMVADRVPSSQLSALIRPSVERLLKEINRLILLFGRESGETVDQIYLSGGGSRLKGLDELIKKQTGVDVLFFRPEEALSCFISPESAGILKKTGYDFSVACGLALCRKPRVDLVPAATKIMQKASALKKAALVGGLILAAGSGAFYISLVNSRGHYAKLIGESKSRLEALAPKIELAQELSLWQSRVARREMIYRNLSYRPSLYGILKELSRITPPEMQLTTVELTGEAAMKVEGRSASPDIQLGRFLTELDNSPYFTGVHLNTSSTSEAGGVRFEINFKLLY